MEFKDNQPIYLQIGDYVCEQIMKDRWHQGERILSVRELGVELQVNPNTVVRSYDFLQTSEIIFNRRGVGYFVSDDAMQKISEYRRKQFLEQDLPLFFKNMELLHFSLDELKKYYDIYRSKGFLKLNN